MMPGGERSDVEAGGKIIMPPSALDQLTRWAETEVIWITGSSLQVEHRLPNVVQALQQEDLSYHSLWSS